MAYGLLFVAGRRGLADVRARRMKLLRLVRGAARETGRFFGLGRLPGPARDGAARPAQARQAASSSRSD